MQILSSIRSILRLHRIAPRTMLSATDEVVPVVPDCAHIAEFALNCLVANKRVTSHNARLPSELAVRAAQGALVDFLMAVFALSHRQGVANVAVHVDLQDPVPDLITFSLAH